MDMIRWLVSNIVVQTAWGLGLLAVLLAFFFGSSKSANEHSVAEPKATIEKVMHVEEAGVTKQAVVATVENTPAVAKTLEAAQSVVNVSTEAVKAEEPVTDKVLDIEAGGPNIGSVVDKSSDDLLMMAREAYWNNGLDEAAELYGILIKREPTVIEHKGELGNVFWRQGYPKKAAELYAEIAAPMIEKGNNERVSNMVGFIGLFFPERASRIRELLANN